MKKAIVIASSCILIGLLIYRYQHQSTIKKGLEREQKNSNWTMIQKGKSFIQNGNIVFRRGADGISDLFSNMNQKDKTYSHCGIAYIEGDSIYIYHSIGGEDNPDQIIKRESYHTFVHPQFNLGYGIIDLKFNDEISHRLDSITHHWYHEKRMFDMDFSLSNDSTRLYCVEFLYKAIQAAMKTDSFFTKSYARDFVYVAPDDILLHPQAQRLIDIVYE
jgi:hypothetical protein